MKNLYALIGLFFFSAVVFGQKDCSTGRYDTVPSFNDVIIKKDIKYGSALNYDEDASVDLMLNVYYPKNDPATNRVLIVFAHGGSFIGGDKNDLDAMCTTYAKLGYTVASINYRLIPQSKMTQILGNLKQAFEEEVVRALYDMKAAVRFFRKTVQDDGNPYGIDPNRIIVGGVSAGAITANQVAYLDQESEIPSNLQNYIDTHGGLEGKSGNPGYSSDIVMSVSMAGAINDTNNINAGSVPFVAVHNDGDQVVPNLYGQPNIGMVIPVDLYGDSLIYKRALNVGVPAAYKMYISNDHATFPQPDARNFITGFLHDRICNNSLSVKVNPEINFSIFPNPSSDKLTVQFNNKGGNFDVQIYDLSGKLVLTSSLNKNQSQSTFDVSKLREGTYIVRIANEAGIISTKKFVKK